MDKRISDYLKEFKKYLRSLPLDERDDAVMEITSHIIEGINSGKSVEAILSSLGDSKELAKAYLSEYHLQQVKGPKINILKSSLFFATTGFISIFVVSFLGLLGLTFSIFTILVPIFGIMKTFGARNIFVIWEGIEVPTILGIPTGVLLGILFFIIAKFVFKLLKGYFVMINAGYRRFLPKS